MNIQRIWKQASNLWPISENQDDTVLENFLVVGAFIRAENKNSPNAGNSLSTKNKTRLIIVLVVAKSIN